MPNRDYRGELQLIRSGMLRGELTYDQAREVAQPIIDEMNTKLKKMCDEDGSRYKPFTFRYLMR